MKSKTLYLLILCASFMVTTIETTMCSNDPIIYNNLELPSTIDLVKAGFGTGFLRNKHIEIKGVVLKEPKQFVVYLMEDGELFETADMPFVFDLVYLPYQPYVQLNNWIKSKEWGRAEQYPSPFKAGEPFILEFVAAPNTYNIIEIFVNNQRLTTFSRMDLSKISQLYIAATEAIKINSLILCNFTVLPPQLCPEQIEIYDLTIPSIIDFVEQGFGIGFGISRKAIIIHGTPTAPTRFDISLIEEGVPEDTADIPFHLSADFAQNAVIRDAWIKGKGWIRNQRAQGLPFTVGQSFKLEFRIAPRNGIDVLVDKKTFVIFTRYDMSKVTQLEIKGAIDVINVTLVFCENKEL